MKLKPKSFISETIEVIFDQTPTFEKKPPCPDGFIWRDEGYRIVELLSEWSDFQEKDTSAFTIPDSLSGLISLTLLRHSLLQIKINTAPE